MYSEEWLENAPNKPGLYFVWQKDIIVYVGETANIQKRMKDLRLTYNHTLRRKVGRENFKDDTAYYPASSSNKFHSTIEEKINVYAMENLKVSYIEFVIGRKEVEQAFIKSKPAPIYNSTSRR